MIDLTPRVHDYDRMLPAVPAVAEVTSYQKLISDSLDTELPPANPPQNDGLGSTSMGTGSLDGSGTPTLDRVYHNSWKGMLARNIGRQVIISFLIGTQETIVTHGILYEVGNDYIVIYNPDRRSYITADFYSIKFVEFVPEASGNTMMQDNTNQNENVMG